MKEYACIILARGGSKSIPNKNIIEFCGLPLIAHSILQSLEVDCIKEVYVSSDSDEILSIAEEYGAIKIKRPNCLADDESTSESALVDAINQIETNKHYDSYIFLQPTSPIRESSDIKGAINLFENENLDSLFSSCKSEDFLIWKIENNKLESVNYNADNRQRRQDKTEEVVENGSIYIFKKDGFLEKENRLFGSIGTYLMSFNKVFEIDSYEDVDVCEFFYRKIYPETAGEAINKFIFDKVKTTLNEDKFPDFDDVYTDTISEIIDRLTIMNIRYWYLEDAMSEEKELEKLAKLRLKSEVLFKEKRPMLIRMLDKLFIKMIKGEITYTPSNIKQYKNWENK